MRAISELITPEALARVSHLSLVARWVVEGFISGLHASPYHGFSVEFAEYRPYTAGDDLRHFDWKALAKSDRKYVKKYHSETNLRAHVVLDCSKSMSFGDPVTKLRYGSCLAAALSYLMIMQQDATGIVLVADRIVKNVPPKATMRHFREIANVLGQAEAASTTSMTPSLHELAEVVGRRGLFVIISDMYDDVPRVLEGLRHLRFNRHEVILFHLLDPREADFPYRVLSEFKDLESGEKIPVQPRVHRPAYLEAMEEFTKGMRRDCSNMLVDYQVLNTRTPFDRALASYLHKRQRLY